MPYTAECTVYFRNILIAAEKTLYTAEINSAEIQHFKSENEIPKRKACDVNKSVKLIRDRQYEGGYLLCRPESVEFWRGNRETNSNKSVFQNWTASSARLQSTSPESNPRMPTLSES